MHADRLSNAEVAFCFGVAVGLSLDVLPPDISPLAPGSLHLWADEMITRRLFDSAVAALSPSARLTVLLAISDSRIAARHTACSCCPEPPSRSR